jgi:hypothetical protein
MNIRGIEVKIVLSLRREIKTKIKYKSILSIEITW